MAEIRHFVTISASPERVYEALTTQSGLSGWWTVDVTALPREGAVLTFDFKPHYHDEMRVTRLVPNQRVEWECIADHDEWVGTTFTFDLEAKDGGTIVRFTHGNWREATDFHALCNTTWAFYMFSLRDYCEKGQGQPFRPE